MQESKTEVVWPRKEARPRIRRKKDSGDGTTWEKKGKTDKAEMDGLCQPRQEAYWDNVIIIKYTIFIVPYSPSALLTSKSSAL